MTILNQLGQRLEGDDPDNNARFGHAVCSSADGKRIAIGAPRDNDEFGKVRIYQNTGYNDWSMIGELSDSKKWNWFGSSLCFSDDGSRLAIGAEGAGIAGYVQVYQWYDDEWITFGSKLYGSMVNDTKFGNSLSLSGDGMYLAIGEPEMPINGIEKCGRIRILKWNNGD